MWFIPLISIIIQAFLVYFINKAISYNIKDIKGVYVFWILYSFYAVVMLIGSYIYLALLNKYKTPHMTINIISVIFTLLVPISISLVLSEQDFVLTLAIFLAIQLCYSLPFYFGVHKCIKYV